jgi:hypothetical protein
MFFAVFQPQVMNPLTKTCVAFHDLLTDVLNKPPMINAATHVSKVYGIAKTGNKVFNAQSVAIGPIMTKNKTNAITRMYFILRLLC